MDYFLAQQSPGQQVEPCWQQLAVRQARTDTSAHHTLLYALDQREYTNPYNCQTVAAGNRYAQQWISSDGRTVVNSNTGVNPNDYTAPGDPTFAPLIPH